MKAMSDHLGMREETIKRSLSGIIYALILWFGTSHSILSYHILFILIAIGCIYDVSKMQSMKYRLWGLLYTLIPLFLIHFLGQYDYDTAPVGPFRMIWDSTIYSSSFKPSLILSILILTWTFDSFAYIIGTLFGKHKIAPLISPKKSWEGFIGGYLASIVAAYIILELNIIEPYFAHNFLFPFQNHIYIITLFVPFSATAGDLFASYLKRKNDIKDFGNYIPGHGGILDRMDSFMITIPILYIYSIIFIW